MGKIICLFTYRLAFLPKIRIPVYSAIDQGETPQLSAQDQNVLLEYFAQDQIVVCEHFAWDQIVVFKHFAQDQNLIAQPSGCDSSTVSILFSQLCSIQMRQSIIFQFSGSSKYNTRQKKFQDSNLMVATPLLY